MNYFITNIYADCDWNIIVFFKIQITDVVGFLNIMNRFLKYQWYYSSKWFKKLTKIKKTQCIYSDRLDI